MKRTSLLFSALLFSSALLMPATVEVSSAAAASGSNPTCSWTINTPAAAFGVLESDGKANCVIFSGFGNVIGIIKLWDFQADHQYHLIAQGSVTVKCANVSGGALCQPQVHAQTGVRPPAGNYHAELEVIGADSSQAPGLVMIDDGNSGGYCQTPC